MKRIFAVWIVLLLLSTKSLAQNNLPPVYEIKNDSIGDMLADYLGQSKNSHAPVSVLEDYSGKLTVEEVMKPPFSLRFFPDTSEKTKLNVYAYWFKYRIKNTMDHAITIAFPNLSAYCDLYVINGNDSMSHFKTGTLVPWSERDGAKRIFSINVVLKPQEEIHCYQRERLTRWFLFKPVELWQGFTSAKEDQGLNYSESGEINNSVLLYNAIVGMLILAFLFNIILFGISRDRLYLLYSAFLFWLVMFTYLTGDGPLGTKSTFVLREYPRLLDTLYWTFESLYLFSLVQFLRIYVELPTRFPNWNKFMRSISGLPLLMIVFPFISPYMSDTWNKLILLSANLLYFLILMSLFVIFLFYFWVRDFKKITLIIVIPFLIFNAIIIPLLDLYWLVLPVYGVKVPTLVVWLTHWGNLISLSSLIILVLFISYYLLKRFDKYREQLAQERIQKETERALLIEQQKTELEKTVEERTAELKHSLNELKSTQAQLIQSEKMASLGELTAGIAHEIQNPLNFVNNFSEVSNELVDEMKEELATGNTQLATEIADDIKQNLEKINHHGKRADAIVKGMLQHSKSSAGIKEPTDINKLADEYLRLAFHGMRAKQKDFNAEIKTDFDESIGKINIVPQDIGRVLLNLYNNAFYAVNEKLKAYGMQHEANYKPCVSVQTKKINNYIEIRVGDNGNGIPQNIIDKIFQPFFTTKPTGEGTGLGLSLSYDIIKAHGGEIKVQTKENNGSEFIILLPNSGVL